MGGLLLSLQQAATVPMAGVNDRLICPRGRAAHAAPEHPLPSASHHQLITRPEPAIARAAGLRFFFPLTATHTRR